MVRMSALSMHKVPSHSATRLHINVNGRHRSQVRSGEVLKQAPSPKQANPMAYQLGSRLHLPLILRANTVLFTFQLHRDGILLFFSLHVVLAPLSSGRFTGSKSLNEDYS